MNTFTLATLLAASSLGAEPTLPPAPTEYQTLPISANAQPTTPPVALPAMLAPGAAPKYTPPVAQPCISDLCATPVRGLFQSDREFEGFVGPVSNPVLSKDPRSNTYARLLFVNNNIPGAHPFGGGSIQAYGLQLNLAINERLSFIADKDGFATISPARGPSTTGWLNLAAGFKYTFYRDVESQTLAAIGFMYEIPTGEAKVFQNHGSGSFAPFITLGKQFCDHWHYLQTTGYYFPVNSSQGSSFIYNSFHIDRQVFGWLYPLAELNWFWYTSGGNRLPAAIGEGDGLINLGTRGQAGAHLVTTAFGAKAVLSRNLTLGAVFEVPVSNRHDVINQRLVVELIARY